MNEKNEDFTLKSGNAKLARLAHSFETLMNSLTSLGVLKDRITDPELLNTQRRCIKQQNEIVNRFFIKNSDEMLHFFCENNTELTWEDIEDNLILYITSRTQVPGTENDELIRASDTIQQNIVTYEQEFEFSMTPEKVRKIVKTMPVMYLKNQTKSLFINLHKLVLTPGAFESILLLGKPGDSESERADTVVDIDSVIDNDCRKGIGGQPSITSKFPQIVDVVAESIKQHGFSAQNYRRTEIGCSTGETVKQIQQHLYDIYPELTEHKISLTTIRRMFQAPNKYLTAAGRYKALINARVGTKQYSYREFHADAHYLFTRNKMRRELETLLSDKISVVSANDMAKVKVGAPAVSRYHQINRIFPEKDGPVLNDHDFPVPGYLISVSGQMFLQDEEKIDVSYDESNSYAVETLSGSEPDFQKMALDGLKGNIFTVLSHQAHIQWNLKMSPIDCRDVIKKGMKEYLPENTTTNDFFAGLDKEVAFDVLDRPLKTTADLL